MFPVQKTGLIKQINSNMVIEVYSWINKQRIKEIMEYHDQLQFEKDLMLRKLSGTLVGYKIYDNMDMEHFNELSETKRNNWSPTRSDFDKDAFINGV